MQKLLPIPTIEHIPLYDHSEALCNKMDKIFTEIQNDILDLKHLSDPLACKSVAINALGNMLNANLKPTDSEEQKRKDVSLAIENNKLYGTWIHVKNIIDDICNGDSTILDKGSTDIWALAGDGSDIDRSMKSTWSCFGIDQQSAQADTYGILLDGSKLIWQMGIFNIDVDNNSLTDDEITLLHEKLLPITPIGMILHIGYVDGEDFINYFIIGE